jgi:hypothetical protein
MRPEELAEMTFAGPRLQTPEQPGFPSFNGGLRDLFATLDDLLGCGGDPRLMLDPISRVNDYGCGLMPSPQTWSFASSTASAISERAYERAGLAREELMRLAIAVGLEEALETRIEEMRGELKAHLALGADVDVIFSPSGTDSQLHALFLGHLLLGEALTTIIVGSDQTGSGTAYTARGRHFNRFTASGAVVRKDTAITGLAADCIALPLADATGLKPRADIDLAVLEAIETVVGRGARVLLQIMDASKLGWRAPSSACLDEIARRWPDKVQVVVDACQMRLGRGRLRACLDRGYMVLVTGSKFFGGPAFSGALLVPSRLARSIDGREGNASGIRGYANRSDWPKGWSLRSHFESRANLGQWLRWEAALEEIGAYYQVPDAWRAAALREFRTRVENLIALSPQLCLIGPGAKAVDLDDQEFCEPTIFPFTIEGKCRAFSSHEYRVLYGALAQDLGDVIGRSASDRDLAARRCLVGQPVRIERSDAAPTAVLRLCAGARIVTETWAPNADIAERNLQAELDCAAEVVAKIELVLAHTEEKGFAELSHGI